MDREQLAQQTEKLLDRYYHSQNSDEYARQMSHLLHHWVMGWRDLTPQPKGKHHAGTCRWCGITHSVPESARLNEAALPTYDDMIKRTEGGPDPLVQEPKR